MSFVYFVLFGFQIQNALLFFVNPYFSGILGFNLLTAFFVVGEKSKLLSKLFHKIIVWALIKSY